MTSYTRPLASLPAPRPASATTAPDAVPRTASICTSTMLHADDRERQRPLESVRKGELYGQEENLTVPRWRTVAPKKLRAHSKKTSAVPTHIPSQTNQPYEQDSKRRIGHFVGVGEPPLMKK